ncbi:MAG: beta-ketoacyl-[acyl-carrier-protein] synthase family protein [Planctomycetota bacterium]|jgi:predicted naringenin-chalcone synthase
MPSRVTARVPDQCAKPIQQRSEGQNRLFIQAIGTAVPGTFVTQDEAVAQMQTILDDPRTHRVIQRAARQSTIEKRHLAILEHLANGERFYRPASEQPGGPRMGIRNAFFDSATETLLQEAWHSLSFESQPPFHTLVTASCTHASSPGLERPLFDDIGLSPDIQRWNLGFMGCSAGLAALRLAHGLPPDQQPALLCTCELSSPHFQYNKDLDQITANMLFSVQQGPRPNHGEHVVL